jgi:uncharacterized protein
MHSLMLRPVYGGPILEELYAAFEEPQCTADIIRKLAPTYAETATAHVIADLTEKGMLVPNRKGDIGLYAELFERGRRMYPIQHMYFIPATGCNFRCRYCFVEDQGRPLTALRMSPETARRGVELFAKLSRGASRISATFYGGEPLLNADVVYFAMHYMRELERAGAFKQQVTMTLLTNGALVDDYTVQAVVETGTKVSVSIDGPEDLHDAARVDLHDHGTFRQALAGFRKLQQGGAQPGVSCTLSRFNVGQIERVTRFIAEELRPSGMGFNILLPQIAGRNQADTCPEFAASQLIAAFKILREFGLYEDRVMRRVRPYVEGKFHLKDCMGVGGQIVIAPDGKIGPCQAFLGLDEYFPLAVESLHAHLDTVDSEAIYANALFDEWRHRFPINMRECSECFAIGVCGGGCPYASAVTHGSIWHVDERVCFQAKQILEWMLWDTYDHFEHPTVERCAATSVAAADGTACSPAIGRT